MHDPVKTPPTVVLDNLTTGNAGVNEAILRVTGAGILPQPVLLQALKDSFFEHVVFYYYMVDPGDVAGPNASVLLQQAVCLAGSLMRHGEDSVGLAASQYEKAKTLIHTGFEPDQLTMDHGTGQAWLREWRFNWVFRNSHRIPIARALGACGEYSGTFR
ncbi:hypothetical protein HER10_EVM0006625 [Colletotrichum scovillei]|uniref:uncharacterized protein n=1 Tax=Colletotrichum scovillei TaxID=1209932 RepID=UPI0015C3CDA3|nr:uncharacterized protein HER10_EVM0006625 [Colletotrichum scovillei]KAF4784296.1 hypothetical protein HER10_EVM0006625 [Colletotrichum scovillei]